MYDIIIYGLLIIIVVRFFYVHAKYPFWSHMPMHHVYDIIVKDCTYIQQYPLRHKYTNPLLIKTLSFLDLNDAYLKYFVELLQIGYTNDDSILCTLQQKNLRAYMTGHNGNALVSFYCNPIYKSVTGPSVQVDLEPEPQGCAASYPVQMQLGTHCIQLNYITYISGKHKQELIATHDYNARKQVNASLLRASNVIGVQPLLQFTVKTCRLPRYLYKVKEIVQIYKQNWAFALDLLEEVHRIRNLVIKIDVGAIRARIEAEEWYVYAFVQRGEPMALYFIENAHMLYENENMKTLRLVASINNGLDIDKFNAGFQDCLRRIVKINLDYKIVTMDCIGDNTSIVLGQPLEEEQSAYYLINWTCKTAVLPENALIVV
jgi:hypothetical protein